MFNMLIDWVVSKYFQWVLWTEYTGIKLNVMFAEWQLNHQFDTWNLDNPMFKLRVVRNPKLFRKPGRSLFYVMIHFTDHVTQKESTVGIFYSGRANSFNLYPSVHQFCEDLEYQLFAKNTDFVDLGMVEQALQATHGAFALGGGYASTSV